MTDQLLFAKSGYSADYHLDGRNGGTVWGIIVLVLVAGGLWVTLAARRGWETLFLILWLIVPAVILLITNSLPWPRYYIMLIAPWSVLAGFAAVPITSSDFLGSVRKFLVRRSASAKSD
jgi:4-amino-4-deoxy-L-arabinose transferase-like glycosyltransferase